MTSIAMDAKSDSSASRWQDKTIKIIETLRE